MYNLIDPSNEQLKSFLIYGDLKDSSVEGFSLFSTSTSLSLYGDLSSRYFVPQISTERISSSLEDFSKLEVLQIERVRLFSIKNLSTFSPLYMTTSICENTPDSSEGEVHSAHEFAEYSHSYLETFVLELRRIYPSCVGISHTLGNITLEETLPLDLSCFFPFLRLSLFIEPCFFNCFIYKSGTLVTMAYDSILDVDILDDSMKEYTTTIENTLDSLSPWKLSEE